jgi:excisionase family DNA binding protein
MTTLAPRLMSGSEAAEYCGVTVATWAKWVAAGSMPKPVIGRQWDRKAIDLALDKASGIVAPSVVPDGQEITLAEWKVQNEARKNSARAGVRK